MLDLTRKDQLLGTLFYMAPEQARGEHQRIDRRADVFALGAILCEILTGTPPHRRAGESNLEFEKVLRRAREGDVAEVGQRLEACGADTELVALTKQCLAVEVSLRPGNAGEVAQAVGAYLSGVQERLRAAERQRAAAECGRRRRIGGQRRRRPVQRRRPGGHGRKRRVRQRRSSEPGRSGGRGV